MCATGYSWVLLPSQSIVSGLRVFNLSPGIEDRTAFFLPLQPFVDGESCKKLTALSPGSERKYIPGEGPSVGTGVLNYKKRKRYVKAQTSTASTLINRIIMIVWHPEKVMSVAVNASVHRANTADGCMASSDSAW